MESVSIGTDGSVRLPKAVLKKLGRSARLLVWASGDTILLKGIVPPRASEIAERAPQTEMPLRAIAAEIQGMRREKRRRRA